MIKVCDTFGNLTICQSKFSSKWTCKISITRITTLWPSNGTKRTIPTTATSLLQPKHTLHSTTTPNSTTIPTIIFIIQTNDVKLSQPSRTIPYPIRQSLTIPRIRLQDLLSSMSPIILQLTSWRTYRKTLFV